MSLIALQRTEKTLEGIDRSQHAYMKEECAADIILFQKIMIDLNFGQKLDVTLVAIDKSQAFDTKNCAKMMNKIVDYTFTTNCDLLGLLYTNTTLSVKIGKQIGQKFSSNRGVPQCDGLSRQYSFAE